MALTTFSSNTVISSSAVNANFSTLADGTNDVANNSLATYRSEAKLYFVASGLIIPTSVTLSASTTAGVAYIAGVRIAPGLTAHTYTASKDTYVDLKNDGTYAYVEVANGATVGMTLTANAIRIAKVVTSGTAITSVVQSPVADPLAGTATNTGQMWDALGNPIYPMQTLMGKVFCTADTAASSSTFVNITGMAISVLLPYNAVINMNGNIDFDSNASASAGSAGTGQVLQSTPGNAGLAGEYIFVNASTVDRKTISQNHTQYLAANTLYTFQVQIQKVSGSGSYTAHTIHSGFTYVVKAT